MPLDPDGFTDHQILVKIWDKLDKHIVEHDKRIAERPTRKELGGYMAGMGIISGIIFGVIQTF